MFTGGIAWLLNWVAPDESARRRGSPAYPATNGDEDKLARPLLSKTADLTWQRRCVHPSNASCQCRHHSAAYLRISVSRRPARDTWPSICTSGNIYPTRGISCSSPLWCYPENPMKKPLSIVLFSMGAYCFSLGTISTEQGNGTFVSINDVNVVDGCIITIYKDGRRSESFDNGDMIITYYANGNKATSYNYNHGNEKFYIFDPVTGARSEPKYNNDDPS